MAHTPGPWTVERSPNYQGVPGLVGALICGDKGCVIVAEIRGAVEVNDARHPENDANAHLISATPALLAALRVIRHNWGGHAEQCATVKKGGKEQCDCDWPMIAKQCDEAIAKAEGV